VNFSPTIRVREVSLSLLVAAFAFVGMVALALVNQEPLDTVNLAPAIAFVGCS
jgi:hypothetical protein